MSTSDEMDKQHRDSEDNSGSVDGENEENSKSVGGNESQAGPNADNTADILGKIGFSKKDKHKKDSELLKQENEELKIQIAELNDKFLRLYAEFDNFKKRSSKERMEWFKTAAQDVIADLLPVLDDFSRASKQIEGSQNVAAVKEGVILIQNKLQNILDSRGLKPMQTIGSEFNPDLHDAIAEIEVTDENLKGKVVEEVQKGYYLNDKIIRHAKVVVGK